MRNKRKVNQLQGRNLSQA